VRTEERQSRLKLPEAAKVTREWSREACEPLIYNRVAKKISADVDSVNNAALNRDCYIGN
jgi:hypothetical protein